MQLIFTVPSPNHLFLSLYRGSLVSVAELESGSSRKFYNSKPVLTKGPT